MMMKINLQTKSSASAVPIGIKSNLTSSSKALSTRRHLVAPTTRKSTPNASPLVIVASYSASTNYGPVGRLKV